MMAGENPDQNARRTTQIAVVGLGAIGSAIAARFIQAGHRPQVWNRSPAPARKLAELGALCSNEPPHCPILFSALADDAAVREVFVESNYLERAPPCIHVNLSTISISLAKELDERHRQHGHRYIAAPVFGRKEAALEGKLVMITGGSREKVRKIDTYLANLAARRFHVGDRPELANLVKLTGNLMIGAAVGSMAEAVLLAESQGLPRQELLSILTTSIFDAPIYRVYGALLSEPGNRSGGYTFALARKDIRLALAAADGRTLPLSECLEKIMASAVADGFDDRDLSAFPNVLEHLASSPRT